MYDRESRRISITWTRIDTNQCTGNINQLMILAANVTATILDAKIRPWDKKVDQISNFDDKREETR